MKRIIYFFASVFTVLFLISSYVYAQDEMGQASPEQKAWMDYMTPGWAHEMLATNVGEWKTAAKFWMSPGSEPSVSEGTAVNEMMMGGRYLKSMNTSTVMNMPMEGMSLEGYDNAAKEFTNIWIDNMGTGIMVGHGNYDKDSKTITYTGNIMDPISGKEMSFRETMKYVDDNTRFMEMFIISDEGQEFKSMEVQYTKKS